MKQKEDEWTRSENMLEVQSGKEQEIVEKRIREG